MNPRSEHHAQFFDFRLVAEVIPTEDEQVEGALRQIGVQLFSVSLEGLERQLMSRKTDVDERARQSEPDFLIFFAIRHENGWRT